MSTEPRPLAVGLMPLETRRDIIQYVATRADALGYTAFTLPETWAYDTTVLCAELAVQTKQIRLAVSVLGIWARSAAMTAMAATTLQEISNGRFILGLGSSTPQLTEGLHDVPYVAPYKKLRQVITQVRMLLCGERVPLYAVPAARPLRLNLQPHPELPIYLAASSAKSIQLAGELCDGWLPAFFPRDRLQDGIALMQAGAARVNSPKAWPQIVPAIPAIVAEDAAVARQGAAWFVAFYLMTMGPLYRNTLVNLGYGKEVECVIAANPGRNPSIVPPEAERLLEQLTVFGTPAQVRQQLALWYDAGASMPSVTLMPNLNREQIDLALHAFRPA